jgi:hypothetical protein
MLLSQKCLSDLRDFFGAVLRVFSKYSISFTNDENLYSFFPVCIPFISFSCFFALAKISSPIPNKTGKLVYALASFLALEEAFQFSPLG